MPLLSLGVLEELLALSVLFGTLASDNERVRLSLSSFLRSRDLARPRCVYKYIANKK